MEFAPRMSRFKPSPSQIASARVRDLIAEGRDIVKLTAGEPDFPTPDHAKAAAIACMDANEIRYTPINGNAGRGAAQIQTRQQSRLRP
jgi:aspartate aminotransferase